MRSIFTMFVLLLLTLNLVSFSGCRKEANVIDISGGCTFSGTKSEGDIDISDSEPAV